MNNLIESIKKTFKTPLKFNITALILPALCIYSFGIIGILYAALLMVFLLLHEYGHVWMGLRQEVSTKYIIVHGFGAAAMLDPYALLGRNKAELKTSAAGPITSFALAALLYPLTLVFPGPITYIIVAINIMLGVFNMLPLFPMDGGRILRSLLAMKFGLIKATKAAAITTYCLGAILAALAVANGYIFAAIIFALVCFLAYREKQAVVGDQ